MTTPPIRTAYDAFWYLMDHPKLNCRQAVLVPDAEVRKIKLSKGERLRKVKDAASWSKGRYTLHELAYRRTALESNLTIFYTLVDKTGSLNDDKAKNKFVECWLEFGPIRYTVFDGKLALSYSHDIRLDCGAATFDAALVKLARLVARKYPHSRYGWCGWSAGVPDG
jgi:hypothetical protein